MSNVHSPFEPGYVGNSDGGTAVDDAPEFPGHRLTELGLTEQELERARADFDRLDQAAQAEFVAALPSISDEQFTDALGDARAEWARQDAYDALSDEDKAALDQLSEDERAALAALTDEERVALTSPAPDEEDDVPTGTVEEVLAWVGNDRGRAETALAVEDRRDKPRAGVVTALTQLLSVQAKPSE